MSSVINQLGSGEIYYSSFNVFEFVHTNAGALSGLTTTLCLQPCERTSKPILQSLNRLSVDLLKTRMQQADRQIRPK